MGANPELKKAAIAELKEGLKNGSIKISIQISCTGCKKKFKTDEEFDNHQIPYIKKNGEQIMICKV